MLENETTSTAADDYLIKYEAKRKSTLKKVRIMLLSAFLSLIGGFVIYYFCIKLFVFFIGLIGFIVLLIIQGRMRRKFNRESKSIVIDIVNNTLDGVYYNPSMGFDLEQALEGGFLSRPDRYFTEDLIRATYNDVPFEMCDAIFQEEHTRTDSDGHTHTEYVTYFKGRLMQFDFKRNLDIVVRVWESKEKRANKGLEKCETESIEFNKKFHTYATSQEDCAYILTPPLLLKMLELEKMFGGKIYFSFQYGKLYLGINNNQDSLDINLRTKINEELVKKIKDQVMIGPSIIYEFGLDKSKFSSNKRNDV